MPMRIKIKEANEFTAFIQDLKALLEKHNAEIFFNQRKGMQVQIGTKSRVLADSACVMSTDL